MLVVYHCAEMESPFKDGTASCLLKHKVDERLEGFSASRAVRESLVQLWSPNSVQPPCPALSQASPGVPGGSWGVLARAESSVGTRREPGLGVWTGDPQRDRSSLLHTCWLQTSEQRWYGSSTAKTGFTRVSLGEFPLPFALPGEWSSSSTSLVHPESHGTSLGSRELLLSSREMKCVSTYLYREITF